MRSNEEKAALGVEILKNCRNEPYSYFPYLDGAFASVSYEAGKGVKGIGTEGNVFYFDPVFLLAGYGNNPEVIRRGYLHMMLHCLYLHLFSNKEQRQDIWNLACDISVEQVIEREALPGLRLPDHPVRKRCLEKLGGRSLSAERICRMLVQGVFSDSLEEMQTAFCLMTTVSGRRSRMQRGQPGQKASGRRFWPTQDKTGIRRNRKQELGKVTVRRRQ